MWDSLTLVAKNQWAPSMRLVNLRTSSCGGCVTHNSPYPQTIIKRACLHEIDAPKRISFIAWTKSLTRGPDIMWKCYCIPIYTLIQFKNIDLWIVVVELNIYKHLIFERSHVVQTWQVHSQHWKPRWHLQSAPLYLSNHDYIFTTTRTKRKFTETVNINNLHYNKWTEYWSIKWQWEWRRRA